MLIACGRQNWDIKIPKSQNAEWNRAGDGPLAKPGGSRTGADRRHSSSWPALPSYGFSWHGRYIPSETSSGLNRC